MGIIKTIPRVDNIIIDAKISFNQAKKIIHFLFQLSLCMGEDNKYTVIIIEVTMYNMELIVIVIFDNTRLLRKDPT